MNKIKTAIEYVKEKKEDEINDLIENIENEEDKLVNYIIKEIIIKKEWNKMKNIWKPYSEKFVTVLINQNKDKNEKDINTLEIKKLINILREKIENTTKIICKNVEIALEMSELEEFHLKIEENIKTKEKKRKGQVDQKSV